MKPLWRGVAALGLLLAVVIGLASPALAETLTIREVDTTGYPEVKIAASVAGGVVRPQDFTVREGGNVVPSIRVVPLGDTDTTVGVVLVIDTSGSMRQNNKLDAAQAAARQFISSKRPRDQIAIVAFSDKPRVVLNFTADAGVAMAAVDGLTAAGETALWDGVQLGTGLLSEQTALQPNVVVLSDGKDTVSVVDAAAARAGALSSRAAVYAVGLKGGADFEGGSLRDLANATGGEYAETADPAALTQLYANVQRSIQNQFEISYTSTAKDVVDVTVSAVGAEARASAPIGSSSGGTATNQPEVVKKSPMPGFLAGSLGKAIIALLVLLAAGLFVYGMALVMMRGKDPSRLEAVLQPYSDADEAFDGERSEVTFAESAFIQRAVNATGRIARERGILDILEKKLEQADLPLRPAEALFFYLAAAALAAVLGLLLNGLMGFAIGVAIVGLGPLGALSFMAGRRRRKFAAQLPDTLQLLAGSLRAGYSLLQGVDAVAQEVSDPMGQELRRVLAEARLGRNLEEALEDAAERMGSGDFSWAVMAVRIQREVGGNLAELLDTVSDTMISRERLRRDVSALTAEGRVSAIVLGILPVAMGFLMYVLNPEYIGRLFDNGLGQVMSIGSGLLALVGFYWMKKVVEIDI